jgi:hypothetical protein
MHSDKAPVILLGNVPYFVVENNNDIHFVNVLSSNNL